MANKECASDRASVGVLVTPAQELLVVIVIVVIDGTVERQQNHLRDLKHEKVIC